MYGKKGFTLVSSLIEFGIITALVIGILGTLNYFGAIPLSQTFSFLSFLPTKNAVQPNIGLNKQTLLVKKPQTASGLLASQKTISNTGEKSKFENFNRSKINVNGEIDIKGNFGIKLNKGSSNMSGFIFSNSLNYTDPNYRHLSLFYSPKGKNWVLEYRAKGKSEYFPLMRGRKNDNGINFLISLNSDGKSVDLTLPAMVENKVKKINLSSSLFENGKNMTIFSQVGPASELNIYSLTYTLSQ